MRKNLTVFPILFFVLFFINNCGYNSEKWKSFKKISVMFSVEKDRKQIDFVWDLSKTDIIIEGDRVVLKNSITDFTVPFSKISSTLKRKDIAGEELINEVEIIGDADNNRTSVICRFTAKGIGGGRGKIGMSMIAAFYLDKYIFSNKKGDLFRLPLMGKLTSSGGKLNRANEFIKSDLELAGAKSSVYTMLASLKDSSSFFHGFVVFDPTNPESLSNAYFEFSSSESSSKWKLSEAR